MSEDPHPPAPPSWDPSTLPMVPLSGDPSTIGVPGDAFTPGYLPRGAAPPPFVPSGATQATPTVELEPPTKNHAWLILGVIAALIAAGGAATLIALLTRHDATPTSNQAVATDVPTSQVAFDQGITGLNTKLDAASGDLCALLVLGNSTSAVADPATVDEVKQAGDYVAKYVTYIADALPVKLNNDAALLREGAALIPGELAAAKYDPAVLESVLSVFDPTSKYGVAFKAVTDQRQLSC